MKAQLFQASFKGGPLDGMTFSVEVGQQFVLVKVVWKMTGGKSKW
jgi:hypothetical protein